MVKSSTLNHQSCLYLVPVPSAFSHTCSSGAIQITELIELRHIGEQLPPLHFGLPLQTVEEVGLKAELPTGPAKSSLFFTKASLPDQQI